jgi:hypothetical protein
MFLPATRVIRPVARMVRPQDYGGFHPDLRVVEIDRRSEAFLLDGVRCELIELRADQLRLECFCVEHEDPGLMLQILHRLGRNPRAIPVIPRA